MILSLISNRIGPFPFRWTREQYSQAGEHGFFPTHRVELLNGEILEQGRPIRWSREVYYELATLGLFENRRVQLIDGEIIEMSPIGNPHAVATELAKRALESMFGPDYWVRVQLPLALSPTSEPEPDLAVVPGQPRDYMQHPTSALLVVEVSDTTLRLDSTLKAALYASAGIDDYWIINLVDNRLDVLRNPVADQNLEPKARYANVQSLAPNDSISPLAMPNSKLSIRDLLP